MTYLPGLVVALAALWFALSGETAPMFVALGALSVLFAVWLSARLRIIGRDASPYHRVFQILLYLAWLLGQILKANLAVIEKVLSPRRAIDPALVQVKTNARSDLGRAFFANSITLTPGTVTVDVEGDLLSVHALERETVRPGAFNRMDRFASRTADPPQGRPKAAPAKAGPAKSDPAKSGKA